MSKIVTFAELNEHKKSDNLWLLVSGKVYDVSKFIEEHPGGDEVLLHDAGRDATESFEDVGHSDEARALLPGMFVGDFETDGELKIRVTPKETTTSSSTTTPAPPQTSSGISYIIPLALLGAYFGWRFYSSGSV